jgi:hypothetical protein
MKQSKLMSLIESTINILVGFGISVAAQAIFLPLLGVEISLCANLAFAVIMTVISVMRSYLLRRLFEALHIRRPLSPFMQAVIAERFRQIDVEGWTPEHDDQEHSPRDLARAGAAYLIGPDRITVTDYEADEEAVPLSGRLIWPWSLDWWKPQGQRRDFVRGCALGIAAGEQSDRQRKSKRSMREAA